MDEKTADKSAGVVAVVAGLIAAVKLARVENREIQNKSPRVRSIISESVTIARMVVEASKSETVTWQQAKRRPDWGVAICGRYVRRSDKQRIAEYFQVHGLSRSFSDWQVVVWARRSCLPGLVYRL
jgi:hypothetical protein